MTDNLKRALEEAVNLEFSYLPDADKLEYDYVFSDKFEMAMRKIFYCADRTYVSVERHRMRRVLVIGLIAVLIMAAAMSVSAIRKPIVKWLVQENIEEGELDVHFDVDDPDKLTESFTYIKPDAPEGYEIVREETYENSYEN